MDEFQSTLDIIRRATGNGPEHLMTSRSGAIYAARWNHPRSETALRGNAEHVLVYHLSGNPDIERRQHGLVTGFRSRVGSVTFMPRNSNNEWRLGGNTQVLHLYLPHDVMHDFSAATLERADSPEIEDFFAVNDPWLDGMFRMLAYAPPPATSDSRMESMVLDQIQSLLIRHLVQQYGRDRSPGLQRACTTGGQLRPSLMRRLNDLLTDRLHEDIRLQDLADLACMSKDHFLRAFRDTVGQTPYHYLMALRFERARTLLRSEPETPVLDIARRCGFKNLSHFSAAFRRHVGASPSHFRNHH